MVRKYGRWQGARVYIAWLRPKNAQMYGWRHKEGPRALGLSGEEMRGEDVGGCPSGEKIEVDFSCREERWAWCSGREGSSLED